MSRVECFKCWQADWLPTGRILTNRFGKPVAECVCQKCGFVFRSPRAEALLAAKMVHNPDDLEIF